MYPTLHEGPMKDALHPVFMSRRYNSRVTRARAAGRTTLLAMMCVAAAAAAQRIPAHTFDAAADGRLPDGFTLSAMRQAAPGTWLVRRQGANGFLVHEADPNAVGLALAMAPDAAPRDVVVSVRVRLAAGGRRGGIVWRYDDEDNYHAALLDLTDGELVLFRVTRGNRIFLEEEDGLELDVQAWHTLKIVHDGAEIAVSLGGIRVFVERDRRYVREAGGGRAGVIATGDSEAWFDDLRIETGRGR